jgi:triosephosphate isomerase
MASQRRPFIAGNWKMNGLRDDGCALARAVAAAATAADGLQCDLVVCPPATLLAPVGEIVSGGPVRLGAQDCHAAESGAHTGDISAAMLTDLGCTEVIVGHSERRADHAEDDALICAKATAAQAAGLNAIVCVGETEQQREAGRALDVITAQLKASVPPNAAAANTVIAYEPVWAIGTGRTPTPEEVQEVHAHARGRLAATHGMVLAEDIRILYGGSVKPANAAEILALPDVDGGLIGGASLDARDFLDIAKSCP